MPKEGWITWPQFVGQINGFLLDIAENSPRDLIAGKAYTATVDSLGIRPQSAALSIPEKLARFDVYSLALSAGGKRENKRDQLGKRELTVAGKVRGALPYLRINFSRDEVEKRFDGAAQLA
jgi:hypothetical protein